MFSFGLIKCSHLLYSRLARQIFDKLLAIAIAISLVFKAKVKVQLLQSIMQLPKRKKYIYVWIWYMKDLTFIGLRAESIY